MFLSSHPYALSYLGLMERRPRYWDYLLAQNPFAEEVLPKAFGYRGTRSP